MSSDPLWQLRNACLTAIGQCEQAELVVKKTQDIAARNRKASLDDLQHKDVQTRQQIGTTLREIREMVSKTERVMTELNIPLDPDASVIAPHRGNLNDLLKSLAEQRGKAHQTFSHLQTTASALKKEKQRKWWKFW